MQSKSYSFLLAVLLAVIPACASSGPGQGQSTSRNQNSAITLEEIEKASAANAYELVQVLRPAWLRVRGTQSFNEGARGVGGGTGASAAVASVPGQDPIIIYLGAARLGGPQALRQIDPRTISSIEYLSRAAADYRFGPGHLHGAIVLTGRT